MADQTRKTRPKKDEEQERSEEQKKTEDVSAEVDELLDEIDEVLEVNAEDFVRGFVQKGGELRALTLEKLAPIITRWVARWEIGLALR